MTRWYPCYFAWFAVLKTAKSALDAASARQLKAPPKPLQSHPKATLKPHQSQMKARYMRGASQGIWCGSLGHPEGIRRVFLGSLVSSRPFFSARGHPEATDLEPEGLRLALDMETAAQCSAQRLPFGILFWRLRV